MIKLRKILAEEFSAYRDYFVPDYSAEIVRNYGQSPEQAMEAASADLRESFPQGVSTPDNHLMCIEGTTAGAPCLAGYLWYSHNSESRKAFICDFYIFEVYRSLGYGTEVLKHLEQLLRSSGVEQIGLRVAYDNKRVLRLYEELGFVKTGINMSKNISSSQ